MRLRHLIFALVAASLLGGCTSSGSAFNPPSSGELLFVWDSTASAIDVYKTPFTGSPIATITNGVGTGYGLLLDGKGDLFVPNYSSNTVTEYAPQYTGAPRTISNGVDQPLWAAFDHSGNLDVTNYGTNTITIYAPPFTGAPITVSNGVSGPYITATDSSGDLFVDNNTAKNVVEYAAGNYAAPLRTVASGLHSTEWLAVAPGSDDLAIEDDGASKIYVYAPPYTGSPTTISTGVANPYPIAFDASGDLFVGNYFAKQLLEFTPPYTGAPAATATLPAQPQNIAIDSSGNVFVACYTSGNGSVVEFARGNYTTPAATITGPGAGFGAVYAVAAYGR
jgi:hypothetical protein